MKFILALSAHLLIGAMLGWGILRTVHGHPMLLIVGLLAYCLVFAKAGCLPKTSH